MFKSILAFFGRILAAIGFGYKDAKIVLLGLDNAGKTTLLYRLKEGAVYRVGPTQRANEEEIVGIMWEIVVSTDTLSRSLVARKCELGILVVMNLFVNYGMTIAALAMP